MHLSLLSLNAFLRPSFVATPRSGGDRRHERRRWLEQHVLPQYDVVALQEAFDTASPHARRLARLFPHHARLPPPPLFSRALFDGGLLTLSRPRIDQRDSVRFTAASGADALAAKGALHCRVWPREDAAPLHLFSTHLQAGRLLFHPADRVRTVQLAQLADFVRSKADGSAAALLLGDLNLDARHPDTHAAVLSALRSRLGDRFAILDLLESAKHPPTNGRGHSRIRYERGSDRGWAGACIDYAFLLRPLHWPEAEVRAVAQVVELRNDDPSLPFTNASDHFGLSVDLTLPLRPAPPAAAPSTAAKELAHTLRSRASLSEAAIHAKPLLIVSAVLLGLVAMAQCALR
jgi:endonuclease/exonuclease/phosphatase family metal-dependent hydrolase